MENTVSLAIDSALSDFWKNLQRKTSVFKHHSTPLCRWGTGALHSGSFLVFLWEQWLWFEASHRMPATFHLWPSLDRDMPKWEWPKEPGQHGFQFNKIWSPRDTGTKPVTTITGITEGLLCARNLRILYSSVSSLWGRDHYLHLIDEKAQVQRS